MNSVSNQEKVCELSSEKEALNEKLQAEEERRRRILTDKNLVRTQHTSETVTKSSAGWS